VHRARWEKIDSAQALGMRFVMPERQNGLGFIV
jgi:hypothetical protein